MRRFSILVRDAGDAGVNETKAVRRAHGAWVPFMDAQNAVAEVRAERDAEVARLRTELATARDAVLAEGLARIDAEKQLDAARTALAACQSPTAALELALKAIEQAQRAQRADDERDQLRAALAVERKECDEMRAILVKEQLRHVPSLAAKVALEWCDVHDARRAAEAKGMDR